MNNPNQMQQVFGVKKHRATRLHYDLRLGWNYVLKSWAIPEGPSYCPGHKRDAIEVEDHNRKYLDREGVIPEGMPGAGHTMLWDSGTWIPSPVCWNVGECLRKGYLRFTLLGQKLKGDWILVRRPGTYRGRRPVWDLIKEQDSFARSEHAPAIVDEEPNSVLSGKSLEQVERERYEGKKQPKRELTLFDIEEFVSK